MKILNLLMWVGQFGFSCIFPALFFLWLGSWIRVRFDLGIWVVLIFGILGILTSIRTAKVCMQSMLKAARELSSSEPPPTAFNDHA